MDHIENTTEALTPINVDNAKELAEAIAEVLDSKKGRDIKVLHVEDKTVIAEYFVLCTGNSSTQIKALAGEVEYRLGLRGAEPYSVEGRDNNSWVLVDYSNVIVHIFSRESREFYSLDKLYGDAEQIDFLDPDKKDD
jgi:ribosome-associated protein